MKELVVATRNQGKLREIAPFVSGFADRVVSASDFEGFAETIEDGLTFESNALKKAREAMQFTGLPALADDSGLVVDVLDGAPGVFSARYAGEGAGDMANNRKLLNELELVPFEQRQAAFVCAMAFVTPAGIEQLFSGRIEGYILTEPRGEGGFGYDPLFLVNSFHRSMAELGLEEKNQISHRGEALKQFRKYLEESGAQIK